MTLRILDLFCGAGGVAAGYVAAGFEVVGVDIEPQPRFRWAFLQHDALTLDLRFIRSFDAVHASPPCQGYSSLRHAPGAKGSPRLIASVRELLQRAGVPWVIENVEGAAADMVDPVTLCGSHFGLGAHGPDGTFYQLQRHRLFEASFPIPQPPCAHVSPVMGVYGGHVRVRSAKHGGRRTADLPGADKPAMARTAMGLENLTMNEMSQAIPPAYTQHIGRALLAHLQARKEAA